jgi:tetratricopeptide (TPR) repeat protein
MMLNLLAGVRLWQGRAREAVQRATQAHRLFVEMDDTMGLTFSLTALATGLVFIGRGEEATELLQRPERKPITSGAPQFTTFVLDAFVAMMLGDGAKAVEIMSAIDVDDASMLATAALAHLVAGDIGQADDVAARAWDLDPEDPGDRAHAGCVRALAAAAVGRTDEAITTAEEALRVGGTYLDRTRAHLAQAFGHAQRGDNDQVRQALDSAREIVDASEDDLHRALVRLAQAVIAFSRGAEAAPGAEPISACRDRLEDLGVSWRAWERAFRLAATGGRSQAIVAPAVE